MRLTAFWLGILAYEPSRHFAPLHSPRIRSEAYRYTATDLVPAIPQCGNLRLSVSAFFSSDLKALWEKRVARRSVCGVGWDETRR